MTAAPVCYVWVPRTKRDMDYAQMHSGAYTRMWKRKLMSRKRCPVLRPDEDFSTQNADSTIARFDLTSGSPRRSDIAAHANAVVVFGRFPSLSRTRL